MRPVDDDLIAERIRELVDAWPPLIEEQVARVSLLLRPSLLGIGPPITQTEAA
jgi:hypothetical protein